MEEFIHDNHPNDQDQESIFNITHLGLDGKRSIRSLPQVPTVAFRKMRVVTVEIKPAVRRIFFSSIFIYLLSFISIVDNPIFPSIHKYHNPHCFHFKRDILSLFFPILICRPLLPPHPSVRQDGSVSRCCFLKLIVEEERVEAAAPHLVQLLFNDSWVKYKG